MGLFDKIFGTYSDKELKKLAVIADKVDGLASKYEGMTDGELSGQTAILKERLANGETTDDILPDAFAAIREASARVLGMRPYRVQIIGGIVLHQGRIAEMRTGEGKTLVATAPAYLNALTGDGVHIVTVNDYLAKRDSEWMGKVYRFMGLTVGLVVHGVKGEDKKAAYNADITYGTNNEFGFDYLRDNMVTYKDQMTQRGHAFAIVDEVDSILVDEARTPLIISGAGDKSTDLYEKADRLAVNLTPFIIKEVDEKQENDDIDADYIIDEKARSATLTSKGRAKAESYFNIESLSDPENAQLFHHVNQAIRARGIMKRDVDYVVKDGEIIIVDEYTGRLMFGRRYSEGLHQAIEAKEKVNVQRENRTLATITFQNYFRLYKKLSGMTGTAETEETEFREIYKLDVVIIPTNRPMIRKDQPDIVYKTERAKERAVIENVVACHEKGQPVLVGTISIEKSEELSAMLKKRGVTHNVLNAKHHDKEAEIVAQAGKKGAVTIATNMAGRGTDIILGGNAEYAAKTEMRRRGFTEELIDASTAHNDTTDEEIIAARETYEELEAKFKEQYAPEAEAVKEAGGLFIIGTERHESRRIDNQLRGRAGRQGDPGESRFYISMEDSLMRLFGGERLYNMMETLKVDEDMPIEAKILSGSIESAQRRVEGRNFDIRKHVLQYDDVMNQQRGVIYEQRRTVLDGQDMRASVMRMIEEVIEMHVTNFMTGESQADYDMEALEGTFKGLFLMGGELTENQPAKLTQDWAKELLTKLAIERYEAKEAEYGQIMREVERVVLLGEVDRHWMDHIDAMDELRKGIGLRSIGQRNPVLEYRFEGFEMFEAMTMAIKEDTLRKLFLVRIQQGVAPKREQVAKPSDTPPSGGKAQPITKKKKVGPNEPCPCGSGSKYKKCCGK